MNKQDRWQKILKLTQEKNKVSSEKIQKECHTSIATVRRDLQQMEDLQLIQRYHSALGMVYTSNSAPLASSR